MGALAPAPIANRLAGTAIFIAALAWLLFGPAWARADAGPETGDAPATAARTADDRSELDKLADLPGIYVHDALDVYGSPLRIGRSDLPKLGGIAAVAGLLYAFDRDITRIFRRNRNEDFYRPIEQTGDFVEPACHIGSNQKYLLGTFGLGYALGMDRVADASIQIVECNLILGGINEAANVVVGRDRPYETDDPYRFSINGGSSFPSGHMVSAFASARIISHHFPCWPVKIGTHAAAAMSGMQRISSRAHWASDVFLSAVLGYAVAGEVIRLNEERSLRFAPVARTPGGGAGLGLAASF